MTYKFTNRAKKAIEFANELALELGHNYIGTEHILYGLVKEGSGVASKVLENQAITADMIIDKIVELVGHEEPIDGTLGFTPRTKRVIENAFIEARKLGYNYIGTEHLLIGILREGDSIAARILLELDTNIPKLYSEIIKVINEGEDFAKEDELVLLCGHYEGIDERVLEEIVTDYVSAGDYVLTGGELPAMMIVDAVSRLIPGVLHNDVSAEFESFQDNLLEYPQYSRPEIWHDRQVPPILLSGHHANVEKWRREQSVIRTAKWRPDLLEDAELTMKERELAEEIIENREKDLKNEE